VIVNQKENHDVRELNHGRRVLDFLKFGFIAFVISMLLVVASFVIILVKGFNLGQDFTGGTTVELTVTKAINLDDLRNSLRDEGYHEPIVQYYGSSKDIIIRLPTTSQSEGSVSSAIDNALGVKISNLVHKNIDSNAEIKRIEFVGPTVGTELAQDGILAICAALICILIYIAFRFEWRFGTGAVVALAHERDFQVNYYCLESKYFIGALFVLGIGLDI